MVDKKVKFKKTREALAAYYRHSDWMDTDQHWADTQAGADAAFKTLAQLERAVGRAFGEDTSDINNVQDCENYVRPGPWLTKTIGGDSCE